MRRSSAGAAMRSGRWPRRLGGYWPSASRAAPSPCATSRSTSSAGGWSRWWRMGRATLPQLCSPRGWRSLMMAAAASLGASEDCRRAADRGDFVLILSAAKSGVKVAALYVPALQRALDAHRRRRRLADLDAYITAGRQLGAERRAAFRSDVERVCLHTQLGPAGLLNLEMLAGRMISLRQAGSFVECGTWRGGALAFFANSYLR